MNAMFQKIDIAGLEKATGSVETLPVQVHLEAQA